MSEECDPIIEAGDDGVILADGEGEVRCPNGHKFDRDEARYQCPDCGAWADGPPPG